MSTASDKSYLGDAVYAEHLGMHVKLTTSDGVSDTNTIYLERGVFDNLVSYIKRLDEAAAEDWVHTRRV